MLTHILTHRELERKDVSEVAGLDDRKSRRVTALLHKRGIVSTRTHRAPFRIAVALPAAVAPNFMPGLSKACLPERPPEVKMSELDEEP